MVYKADAEDRKRGVTPETLFPGYYYYYYYYY